MEIKIAIVDDVKEDIDKLEECVTEYFCGRDSVEFSCERFRSAEEFLPEFEPAKYNMVFLDICMNEIDGIELGKRIRNEDPQLMIVFQTTERGYAFDAFPIHPFDYLIKPCVQDDVERVLAEALRVLEAGDPTIIISTRGATYKVPLRSIVGISSRGHNVDLSLTNKQQLTSTETFKSVSHKIDDDPRFIQINRGIIINMDHVFSPVNEGMQMKDGTIYPIRVNGRGRVLSEFSQYMISKVDMRG